MDQPILRRIGAVSMSLIFILTTNVGYIGKALAEDDKSVETEKSETEAPDTDEGGMTRSLRIKTCPGNYPSMLRQTSVCPTSKWGAWCFTIQTHDVETIRILEIGGGLSVVLEEVREGV